MSAVKTPQGDDVPLETTGQLLARVRDGDAQARDRLIARYLPMVRGWARGRLPRSARDLAETDDLVQGTMLRALGQLDSFEPRREGAFLAYLRTALRSAVIDEIRRSGRRGPGEPLDEWELADPRIGANEPFDRAGLRAYETALSQLPDVQREAVILRLELGFSFVEIAAAIDIASADAARMAVKRGLARIAREMSDWSP